MVRSVNVVDGGADMLSPMTSLGETVCMSDAGAGWLMGSNELRPLKSRGSSKRLPASSPTDAEAKEKSKSVAIAVSRSVSESGDGVSPGGGLPVLLVNDVAVMCCCC